MVKSAGIPKGNGERKSISKSKKAGLVFPVAKESKVLRTAWKGRVGSTAPVYMAGILEYVAAELLQAAGDIAKKQGVKRITPALISQGIRQDLELHKMMAGAVLFAGDKVKGISEAITHPADAKAAKVKADHKKAGASGA